MVKLTHVVKSVESLCQTHCRCNGQIFSVILWSNCRLQEMEVLDSNNQTMATGVYYNITCVCLTYICTATYTNGQGKSETHFLLFIFWP